MKFAQVCLAVGTALVAIQAAAQEATYRYPDDWQWGSFPGSISSELAYDYQLRDLGEHAIDKSSEHDVIRFLIGISFDTLLVINATKHHWLDATDDGLTWTYDTSLTVTYVDLPERVEKLANGNHFSKSVERFYVEVSEQEFEATVDALFQRQFFTDPNYIPVKKLCTDGITYYVEAKIGNHYNLIARSYCSPRFLEDFSDARIILTLAREKLPMLNAKFDAIEKNVQEFEKQ